MNEQNLENHIASLEEKIINMQTELNILKAKPSKKKKILKVLGYAISMLTVLVVVFLLLGTAELVVQAQNDLEAHEQKYNQFVDATYKKYEAQDDYILHLESRIEKLEISVLDIYETIEFIGTMFGSLYADVHG